MTKTEKALWVIGDIHGMYDPLRRIVDQIRFSESYRQGQGNPTDTTLIFIGDYIDYGPSSREVVDLLLALKKEFNCVFLCGNHEDMMLQFLKNEDLFERFGNMWFRGAGGQSTVVSFMPTPDIYRRVYGQNNDNRDFSRHDVVLDQVYLDFFESLVYAHTETLEVDDQRLRFAFTHASLIGKPKEEDEWSRKKPQPTVAEQLALKTYQDFHDFRKATGIWIEELHLWNRTLPDEKFDEYILIHGHTPTPLYDKKYAELGLFKPASALPYIRFVNPEPLEVYKDSYRMTFRRSLGDIISINIDTGAAYGKALGAIYLNKNDLFEKQSFKTYRAFLDASRVEEGVRFMEMRFDA